MINDETIEFMRARGVLRCLHAIDATRVHQTRSWVVSFLISRPFGLSRATAMLRAGEISGPDLAAASFNK